MNRSHGWEPALRNAIARYGSANTDTRHLWRKVLSRLWAIPLEHHNQQVLRWSDGVVLCSMDDPDLITDRYGTCTEKLLALAPGIDPWYLEPLSQPCNHPDCWSWILGFGNFCPPKAPEVVASVFRGVATTVKGFEGTWVCPKMFHKDVCALLGDAAGLVKCKDWMSKKDLRTLFDRHGLFLFPCYFEGLALTFLQAMARRLCVLGTRGDAMRQTLRDGINGFRFERGDAEGITARALRWQENPEELKSISRNARMSAEEYTWLQSAHRYSDFCSTLLERRKKLYCKC